MSNPEELKPCKKRGGAIFSDLLGMLPDSFFQMPDNNSKKPSFSRENVATGLDGRGKERRKRASPIF